MTNKKSTINDVAREAGVSKRTVSRVINGSTKVKQKTLEKINAVIQALDFVPNTQARGLATSRSYLLGLVYDTPTIFITDIEKGILEVCGELGYELVVHPCAADADDMIEGLMQFVKRSRIDGVIILPPLSERDDIAEALIANDCHYVRMTSSLQDSRDRLVVSDYEPSIKAMVSHLYELGHRNMGFISGPKGSISSLKRLAAYQASLKTYGLEVQAAHIAKGEYTFESGARAAKKLVGIKNGPTVIFAANDEMAMGVIKYAHTLGLSVPEDLSVVGFDGTWIASRFIPSLTTVHRPVKEMAKLATRKLLANISGEESVARNYDVHVVPEFIKAESTGLSAF